MPPSSLPGEGGNFSAYHVYQEKFLKNTSPPLEKHRQNSDTSCSRKQLLSRSGESMEIVEKLFTILAIVGVLGAFFFLQKAGITSGG